MKAPIRAEYLADLTDEWLRYIHPLVGKVAKALVVDLDDTMWGGVLGEDGLDGLRVGPESSGAGYARLQRSILALRARGILLAACSKNNHADVVEALESHPEMLIRPESFSVIRANWESKVENLAAIAAELNIGLDSLAFLDDSPFECNLIRQALPEVTVIELDREPTEQWNPIEGNPLFERLALVAEDRNRVRYYAEQRSRQQALDASGSVEDYLRSLGTTVSVAPAAADDVERVAQLTQKTNQFNMTTRRYTESDIKRFVDDSAWVVWVARASDRFGDHGLIGTVIVRADSSVWDIDTLLLSCRVIGRGVERAMLSVVADTARDLGAAVLEGTFVPTAKNAPASGFYEESGFACVEEGSIAEDSSTWRLALETASIEPPSWIQMHDDEATNSR
jgi:FkbH-like protein